MEIKADVKLKFKFNSCNILLDFTKSDKDKLYYKLLNLEGTSIIDLVIVMDTEENYHIAALQSKFNGFITPEYLDDIKKVLNYYNGYEYDGSCEENDLPF